MSINFNQPMNDDARAMIEEMFREGIAAMDDKTALINNISVLSSNMSSLAKAAKQPVQVELHGVGDIKTMSDGTQYRVTPRGWLRITQKGETK